MFQIDTRHSFESRSSSNGLAPAYVINFPLHHAIRSYNQGPAIELITTTEKAIASALNTFDYFGDSPLYLAVHNKLGSVIDVLILFGADTQKVNSRGDTLQIALEKCRFCFAVFEGFSSTSLNQQHLSLHLTHLVASLQDDVSQPSRKHKHRPTLQRTQVSTLTPLPIPQRYRSQSLGQHSTGGTPRSHSTFSITKPFRLSSSNAPLKSLEKESSYNPEITSYLNTVKKMLEGRQFDLLSHTYFLFIDEDILLDCLLSMGLKHKKPISKFILSLMAHGFPNGLDKMAASSKKLAELTRVYGIDFPFINQIAAGNIVLKNPLQSSQTSEVTSINEKSYHHITPLELADMLTFRDVESISQIEFSEVKEWLHDEKNISVSIRTAGDNFNKTAKWIVWILDSCEGEAQDSAIEFFTSTGTILLNNANFHGAMQISVGFNLAGCTDKISNFGKDAIALLNFSCYNNNYLYYRAAIDSLEKGKPYLPYLSLVWRDIKMTHEHLTNDPSLQMKISTLESLSHSVKLLLNFRKSFYAEPDWKQMTSFPQFLFHLPDAEQQKS